MANPDNLSPNPTWERTALEKLLFNTLKEQRRKRRWGVFFKLLFFIYLTIVLWLIWPSEVSVPTGKDKGHTALIDMSGEIMDNAAASADNVATGLQAAFKDKSTKAIILRINSPGGSPVQASDIYDEIRYQRARHPKIKIYTVCTDLCTSAAYYVASATDQIYANPSSLVGSIGVLMDGFGFVGTLEKLGIQRRLMTSGDHKGFLDPFSPIKPEEQQYAQKLLDDVHQQFARNVQQGRGKRLKNTPDIFSGLVWTGNQALPLGLIDGFGNAETVARDIIKNDNVIDYTYKPGVFQQLADRVGASFAHTISEQLGLKLHATY